jgi:hypothetical protein
MLENMMRQDSAMLFVTPPGNRRRRLTRYDPDPPNVRKPHTTDDERQPRSSRRAMPIMGKSEATSDGSTPERRSTTTPVG